MDRKKSLLKYSSQVTSIIAAARSLVQEKGVENFIKNEMVHIFENYQALETLCEEMNCVSVEELEQKLLESCEDIVETVKEFHSTESAWNKFLSDLDAQLLYPEDLECKEFKDFQLRPLDQPDQILKFSQVLKSNSNEFKWVVFLRFAG